jgi:putative transcriptional regulator
MKHILHNTILDLRTTQGVTQQELADAVGVSRQTIIAIEKGNYTPSVTLALALATYFDTHVEDIFFYA